MMHTEAGESPSVKTGTGAVANNKTHLLYKYMKRQQKYISLIPNQVDFSYAIYPLEIVEALLPQISLIIAHEASSIPLVPQRGNGLFVQIDVLESDVWMNFSPSTTFNLEFTKNYPT